MNEQFLKAGKQNVWESHTVATLGKDKYEFKFQHQARNEEKVKEAIRGTIYVALCEVNEDNAKRHDEIKYDFVKIEQVSSDRVVPPSPRSLKESANLAKEEREKQL